MTKICPICGREFEPVNDRHKYCSTACKQRANYLLYKQRYPDRVKKRKKHKYTCAICGKEFEAERERKYCTPECRKIAENERARKFQQQRRVKAVKKPQICVVCGKSFMPNSSNAKYCSDECRGKMGRQKYDAFTAKELTPQEREKLVERNRQLERERLGENYSAAVEKNEEARKNGMSWGKYYAPKVEVKIPAWVRMV